MRPAIAALRAGLLLALLGAAGLRGADWSIPADGSADGLNVWSAADFDGDSIVDLAGVSVGETSGAFQIGSARLASPGSHAGFAQARILPSVQLTLQARDLDHDQDLDLVLREVFTNRRLAVWTNSGRGEFTRVSTAEAEAATPSGPELGRDTRGAVEPQARVSSRTSVPIPAQASRNQNIPRPRRTLAGRARFTLQGCQDPSSCRGPPSPIRS